MKYPIHPVASLFPPMSDAEFTALRDDIEQNGLAVPVIVFNGQIIDGVHRARACKELSLNLLTQPHEGTEEDLVNFVVSLNMNRRHLSTSQRAMVAARIANMEHRRPPVNPPIGGFTPVSRQGAAALLNVGTTSLDRARQLRQEAEPPVIEAVEAGQVTVARGLEIAKLPPKEQEAAVSNGGVTLKKRPSHKSDPNVVLVKAAGMLTVIADSLERMNIQSIGDVTPALDGMRDMGRIRRVFRAIEKGAHSVTA